MIVETNFDMEFNIYINIRVLTQYFIMINVVTVGN